MTDPFTNKIGPIYSPEFIPKDGYRQVGKNLWIRTDEVEPQRVDPEPKNASNELPCNNEHRPDEGQHIERNSTEEQMKLFQKHTVAFNYFCKKYLQPTKGITAKLWDFAAHLNAPPKDLVSLANALIQGDGRALELGAKGIPAVLPDSVTGLEEFLKFPSPPPSSASSKNVETIMGLFLHTKVAHFATFYERMDFKNVSTERGEGFNYFVKFVLKRFTCHNLETAQPFREVLVRWFVCIPLFDTFYTHNATISKIDREFKNHIFEELDVDMTTYYKDLQIFLPHLEQQGYREGADWKLVEKEGKSTIVFNTLSETLEIFHKYS